MKKSLFYIGGCAGTSNPPSAKISFPSVHNSTPLSVPHPRGEFGSLTTAFGIVDGELGFFVDNGSGVSNISQFILKSGVTKVFGLQTHWHEDHTNGLQVNGLLFKKGLVEEIWAPKLGKKSFQEIFDHDFDTQVWPISPEKTGIKHSIKEFELGATLALPVPVSSFRLAHPGGSAGYRFQCEGGAVVISTDHEIAKGDEAEFSRFISDATYLYIDVQYRDAEYQGARGVGGGPPMLREGWGHSTPSMLGSVLSRTEVLPKVILIGHHDPARDDGDLSCFEQEVQDVLKVFGSEVRFARECDSFEI